MGHYNPAIILFEKVANVYAHNFPGDSPGVETKKLFFITFKVANNKDTNTHPLLDRAQSNLALTYWDLGLFDKAAALLEKSLASNLRALGKAHPTVADCPSNLGLVYLDVGRNEEARHLAGQTHHTFFTKFSPDHPNTQAVKSLLDKPTPF